MKTTDANTLRTLVASMAKAGDTDRVSVDDLVTSLGPGAFGPLLLVPSLTAASPLSAVFGVATICGLMIAVLSGQLMAKQPQIWLPKFVLERSIERQRINWAYRRLETSLKWIEQHSQPRFLWLMQHPFGNLPGSICFAIGCVMPFMELVPFSATLGGVSVALMVVGLLLHDGLYVALGIGFALSIVTVVANVLL